MTPLAIQELKPSPLLPNLQLHVAALLVGNGPGQSPEGRIVVVPVPSQLPRWVTLPSQSQTHLARVDDVIAANLGAMFPDDEVAATAAFRISRDADVVLKDDEEIDDLLHAMEEVVLSRRWRAAVRLTISARPDARLRAWLADWLKLGDEAIYEVDGPLESSALMELANRRGFDDLKIDDWPPQVPRDLIGAEDLWQAVQDHDVLLYHPYESFDPVVKLVEQAADDPQVLAIKQTLYRTSGDSPIIRALARAAQNGKEVIALVELKARFDEWRNVNWARRLEDAGVHVIYGIAGFKTHAKALLIVRREAQRIRRYVHLATGNYNDRTARLYSDIGLLTCDRELVSDVAAFFNLLTGYSETVGWAKLAVAPIGLRQKFIDLIDREIQASTSDRPGPDYGQDQLAARPGNLPGAVPREPGRREGSAKCPRHLLPAAGHTRQIREYRGPLDRRSIPGARPGFLLPQRRARRSLSQQCRLDAAEPEQAARTALSRDRSRPSAAADRRAGDLFRRQRQGMASFERWHLRAPVARKKKEPRVRSQQHSTAPQSPRCATPPTPSRVFAR